jgi:hypothetical protein
VLVITFVIPFFYGAGTVINDGFDSDFLTSCGSGSIRQKSYGSYSSGSDSTTLLEELMSDKMTLLVPGEEVLYE